MKRIEWITNNRMRFESKHKTFNKQADCISTGNMIGDVQLSFYVRPRNEIKCNGNVFRKGHLQEYDLCESLKYFPEFVKEFIRQLPYAKDHHVIAYEFRHWNGKKKIIHGYVVTTGYDNHELLKKWYCRKDEKSRSVVDEAIKYITNP